MELEINKLQRVYQLILLPTPNPSNTPDAMVEKEDYKLKITRW